MCLHRRCTLRCPNPWMVQSQQADFLESRGVDKYLHAARIWCPFLALMTSQCFRCGTELPGWIEFRDKACDAAAELKRQGMVVSLLHVHPREARINPYDFQAAQVQCCARVVRAVRSRSGLGLAVRPCVLYRSTSYSTQNSTQKPCKHTPCSSATQRNVATRCTASTRLWRAMPL